MAAKVNNKKTPVEVIKKDNERTVIRDASGKVRTLLTPHGRGKKFAEELSNDVEIRNDGKLRLDSDGDAIPLSSTQRAFRAGYLQAQKDAANAYKSKHPRYSRKS